MTYGDSENSPPLSTRHRSARRQIMLDQAVQGTLMKRVTTYWFLCLGSLVLTSWIWNTFLNPGLTVDMWVQEHLGPLMAPMIGSLVLLPLAWADMIRLSNRIVAPVHSIRTAIRRLLLGDDVPPLVSRTDDFWPELTKQFNRFAAIATLERAQPPRSEPAKSRESDHVSVG